MLLPCVTPLTRERIARELDDRGPEACLTESLQELSAGNPEVLDIITRCAASFGDRSAKVLLELCIFYRLLSAEFGAMHPALRVLTPVPRVTPETRDKIVRQIDGQGVSAFTLDAIGHIEQHNPELLQMANESATRHASFLPMMQGFALVYKTLAEQAAADAATIAVH